MEDLSPSRLPAPLATAHALLDPSQLSRATEDAVAQLTSQGQSANTLASYAAAMRYWAAWYGARYGLVLAMPVPVPVVVQFIADHAAREVVPEGQEGAALSPVRTAKARRATASAKAGKPVETTFDLPREIDQALVAQGYKGKVGAFALNTLLHRVSVLSKAHQVRDLDNPCNHPGVRELLSNVRRGHADRGVRTKKQTALTKAPFEAVLATCDDTPRGVRDRALLLFAWASGGRRRSEVTSAVMENLEDKGFEDGFDYLLLHSKGNQEGNEDDDVRKPIVGKAAEALRQWLKVGAITEGPIFRRVLKGGKVTVDALDPESVRKMVQARCALAGLPGHFSAHSLRSGFVTEAGRRGLPTAEAMKMTGHKKIETFMSYYQQGNLRNSKAARMMEDELLKDDDE